MFINLLPFHRGKGNLRSEGNEYLVRMVNITKRFPGVTANDGVNFDLMAGEVHALLGENGAGKTTLMNILYGIHRPDCGEIYVKGKKVDIRSPKDAIKLGIGMVHQHFLFVEDHSVIENLALGLSRRILGYEREIEEKIKTLEEKYKIKVNLKGYIWQLSLGEQQKVEILRALLRGSDVLILDEPTSVLTPQEAKDLFNSLREMKLDGKGIIFITHKLNEVFEIADRVTVMRRGRVIATLNPRQVTAEELARIMVSSEIPPRAERPRRSTGGVVLDVRDLVVIGDRGEESVKGVSFRVREGEIFGIGGVAGNGQSELVQSIVGLRKVSGGKIVVMGKDVTNSSPREITELGVAYIPEERIKFGLVPNMSIAENTVLKKYYKDPFSFRKILNYDEIFDHANRVVEEFGIVASSVRAPARNLSGGNIQRLIVGRELIGEPKVIVASNPTQGLDVAATEYIRSVLLAHRDRGAGILLVSSDLDELLELSDRIAVMFRGKFTGVVEPGAVSTEELGLMMSGGISLEIS